MLQIAPLNTFSYVVTLRKVAVVSTVARPVALEQADGPVFAFLSGSKAPTATEPVPAWRVSATYTGLDGKWLIVLPGSVLQPSDMDDAANGGTTLYLIIEQPDNIRRYVELEYVQSLPAVVN